MVIGIVTEAKDKTKNQFPDRFFKRYAKDWIKTPANPFDAIALVLPYSKKRLEKMSAGRLLKIVERAVSHLKKHGAGKVIASELLSEILIGKSIVCEVLRQSEAGQVFLKLAPECVRRTAATLQLNLLNASVCISDTKMDRISGYLIRELCYDTKNLTVCTQNTAAAEAFCEAFFDETGFFVSVRESVSKSFDVLIDVDEGFIQFGRDLFVRNVDLGYDFGGYKVKSLDAAACLKAVDTSKLICIYEYSKKG